MKKPVYSVIVSNIGTVYTGSNGRDARRAFNEYREQSVANYGRAAGESVVLLRDGDFIVREHAGSLAAAE